MEILIQIEVEIRIECRLTCQLTFTVLIIPAVVPHRVTSVEILAYIIRDIGNDKLCRRYGIFLIVLH